MKLVAIDFETANPASQSACALGVTVFEEGVLVFCESWLIQPHPFYNSFYSSFIDIHGIHPRDVEDAPEFPVIFELLLPWLQDSILCAHNAGFDVKVLTSLCSLYKLPLLNCPYFCTVELSRRVFPYLERHKLNVVSEYLHIQLDHHDAGSDARACALIVINAMNLIQCYDLEQFIQGCSLKLKQLLD